MKDFLYRFTDKNEYNNYIANIPQLSRPQVCYCRDGRLISYFPITLKIICDDSITSKTYQCSATANGVKRTAVSSFIVEGSQYATISNSGLLTMSQQANNSKIKILCKFGMSTAMKECFVTYNENFDIITDIETVKNADGTNTEITTRSTENADGTSSVESVSIVYNENGTTDGSFNSTKTNYDSNGNPTSAENKSGDELHNVNTQEITYKNGKPIVSGYSIDTSSNTETGTYAIESTTEGGVSVDTQFIPFDGENGFELDFHFKCAWDDQPKTPPVPDPKDSTYHYTIINFKREVKPWPGFALRAQNNNKNAIILSTVFEDGTKITSNIAYPSDNIFHIRFTYDPSIPNFTVDNVLTGKNVLSRNKIFRQLDDITVTVGCSMYNEANPPYPYRYSNIEIYNFNLTKLNKNAS